MRSRLTRHRTLAACGATALSIAAPAMAQCLPRWMSGGDSGGPGSYVYAMTTWDPDGPGPRPTVLVVGGTFSSVAGNTSIQRVATWDGTTWAAVGTCRVAPRALAVMPNGDLIAGGDVGASGGSYIARWNGTAWVPMGTGVNDRVNAMTVTTTGDLIVGGQFSTAGGVATGGIARWTPSTGAWSPIGTGVNMPVFALAPMSTGGFVAGGTFTTAGGIAARFIARWNAATNSWMAMNSGAMTNLVASLAVLPSGQVIAGGYFEARNGFPGNYIARWDGTNWQQMGAGGMNLSVSALSVMPDGNVLVGGTFTTAGGLSANRIAIWNTAGGTWSTLGAGLNSGVYATGVFNGEPVAGGGFQMSGSDSCPYFAHYGTPAAPSVVTHPQDATFCAGNQVMVEVTGSGTAPFTYVWQIATSQSTWATLSATPITLPCGGTAYANGAGGRQAGIVIQPCSGITEYRVRCVLSNACGSATSQAATLTKAAGVVPPDPQDVLACVGGEAAFETAGSGPGPYTFMWLKNGDVINATANPSAATARLVLRNLTLEDAGVYNCLVYNLCSGASTNYATLEVRDAASCCPADFNDDGFLDYADFDAFVVAFEAGDASSDFNADGFLDYADFDAFVIAFESGC